MSRVPDATVVVVARDRWTATPARVRQLIDTTGPHPVVVVAAGARPSVVRELAQPQRDDALGRVEVVPSDAFLPGNEARNRGASSATGEWLAFVENDVVMSDGWLDALLERGAATGADVVFPAFLVPGPDGPVVHGLGCELEVDGPLGAQRVRETQHLIGRRWDEVEGEVVETERVQSEPHCFVVRRSLYDDLGGLDPGLLGWFDHTDLALHVRARGARSLLVPQATCLYGPPSLALNDLPTFAKRWGVPWYQASLRHLCATWGLDPLDGEWDGHANYRAAVRRSVPTPWPRVNGLLARVGAPLEGARSR